MNDAFDVAVLRALVERDGPRRRRLVKELELRPPASLAADTARSLEQALRNDADISARLAATEVLAALGDVGVVLLRSLLRDPNPGVRRLAVDALGLVRTPDAMAALEEGAGDDSPAVRAAALDGIARVGGNAAVAALQRQLDDAKVPATVALAALLGLEQLGATPPSASLKRWLQDPLTAGAAIRLLGRGGDAASILPSLSAASLTRQRAAVLGLADALEHGTPAPAQLYESASRAQLAHHVKTGDWTVASAGLVALGHVGDLSAVAAAAARDDRSRLLPALHRLVELVGKSDDVAPRLLKLADEAPDGADVLRELAEAAALRRREGVRATLALPDRRAGRGLPRPILGEAEFQRLSQWFERAAGLLITPEARARVEARLVARLEATRKSDFTRYLQLLESGDADERAAAVECVTVHETYFFREPATLDGFRDEIAPALLERRKVLRVWSAGCSTGEEPYTLAILLEQLKSQGRLADYEVWGTDISPQAIAKARHAQYAARSFRRPLDDAEAAFFVDAPVAKGADVVRTPSPRVLMHTRFETVNLVDAAAVERLPTFDIVFCRNVLIYFSGPARAKAVDAFHGRLRPGGALVLGHSESLLHVENPFEPWPLRRGLAYRRSFT